jgi:signal transduction histidine kinase
MRGLTRARGGVSSLPLYWRVFVTNASTMLLAFAALVLAPVTVSVPVGAGELIVLAIGLLLVVMVNLLLTLTGAMLQVEGLAPRIPDDLRDEFDELRETARSGTEDVRRIARQLRPEALEDLGLQSALAALATSFGDQAQVRVERRLEPSLPLSEDEELVVYRVAQEALTNVARHAQATRVELRLQRNHALTVLTVRDDGLGLVAGGLPSGHGIRGMRERAMLIGAQLHIDSKPGGGTEIKLSIPLDLQAPCRSR